MAMKTLDLDAVQAFVLVASLANFTRVGEATGMTQSAVSLKLKRLETFLGRRLVERTPRSVALTAEGEAFLAHAKTLLAASARCPSLQPPPTACGSASAITRRDRSCRRCLRVCTRRIPP
jgi:DNA-binding transcriptional LysR family regulator